jgi:LCP family protein required for cell wall assembly
VRPDALLVLHLDPVSGSCRGLAVPRDTLVELPGYGPTKINHALMVGGIAYQKLVTERFLGITIDHYALIDFEGFKELVDAVGGVPVTVPADITKGETVLFTAGPQVFTGDQALSYARYRGDSDLDVGRVRRQQQIIRGLITVADGRSVASDVNALLPAVADHIRTDLSPADLIALAEAYRVDCGEGALLLDTLQGDLVQPGTLDPLFQQELAYVVVPSGVVEEKVGVLLRGD